MTSLLPRRWDPYSSLRLRAFLSGRGTEEVCTRFLDPSWLVYQASGNGMLFGKKTCLIVTFNFTTNTVHLLGLDRITYLPRVRKQYELYISTKRGFRKYILRNCPLQRRTNRITGTHLQYSSAPIRRCPTSQYILHYRFRLPQYT